LNTLKINNILSLLIERSKETADYVDIERIEFEDWVKYKEKKYFEINSAIFKSKNKLSYRQNYYHQSSDMVMEGLYWIYRMQLKNRVKIIRKLKKIGIYSIRNFIFFSKIILFAQLTYSIMKYCRRYFLKYSIDSNVQYDLSVGFPSHSFIVSSDNEDVSTSFANFYKKINQSSDKRLLNLGVYTRPSAKNDVLKRESSLVIATPTEKFGVSTYDFIYCAQNIKYFLKDLINNGVLFALYLLGKKIQIHPLRTFIKENKNINNVYILIYSEFNFLKYDKWIGGKCITFAYAQNFYEFPCRYNFDKKNIEENLDNELRYISPNSWAISGQFIGYTDVTNYTKMIRSKYDFSHHNNDFHSPAVLGYETNQINFDEEKKYAVIFDTPPESTGENLSNHICGDFFATLSYCKNWLIEVVGILNSIGYPIIIKPKYSLVNYSKEYRDLMEFLIKDHNVIVINPYETLASIKRKSNFWISMPFSSTHELASIWGISSFFYMPDIYNVKEYKNLLPYNFVTGKDELISRLKEVCYE